MPSCDRIGWISAKDLPAYWSSPMLRKAKVKGSNPAAARWILMREGQVWFKNYHHLLGFSSTPENVSLTHSLSLKFSFSSSLPHTHQTNTRSHTHFHIFTITLSLFLSHALSFTLVHIRALSLYLSLTNRPTHPQPQPHTHTFSHTHHLSPHPHHHQKNLIEFSRKTWDYVSRVWPVPGNRTDRVREDVRRRKSSSGQFSETVRFKDATGPGIGIGRF